MNFFDKVFCICQLIPYGKVASYGQIAELTGNRRMARQVGWALNKSSNENLLPAHRVVNREGFLSGAKAFFFQDEQAGKLREEGVLVKGGKVDMKKYGWVPSQEEMQDIVKKLEGFT